MSGAFSCALCGIGGRDWRAAQVRLVTAKEDIEALAFLGGASTASLQESPKVG